MGSLTQPQRKRLAKLRGEQILIEEGKRSPGRRASRRPADRSAGQHPPGKTARVARVQSYLSLERC
jgi:hypothetical protein